MSEKEIKRQVKGYLIAYRLVGAPIKEVKTMYLAHYSRKEVADLFNRYASAKKYALAFVMFKKIKKTKLNEHWHTKEYVQREEEQVRILERKDLN